jgi:putative toxin-antitoxin system antitoxin component (TIGR02293 family)
MLTNKSVVASQSKVKSGAKARLTKSASRPALVPSTSPSNLASEPVAAAYLVREQRVFNERALVASLLDQPEFASDMEIVNLIHNRLSLGVIDRLLAQGVTKQELNLVAPARTLAHRRANAEPLTIEESDRAMRLARVVAQADAVFGNQEKAMSWLRHALKRFEGRTPLDMLATDVGSRLVEEALVQIDEGFYA